MTDMPVGEATRAEEVRAAHRFAIEPLEAFFARNVEGFRGRLSVRQFQGGMSNPTFLITAEDMPGLRRFVLRKKPPGKLLNSAHQVDREYRIIAALKDTGVPVPPLVAFGEDEAIIGTQFYVMEYLDGRIFRDASLPGESPSDRAAIYDDLGGVLANLHGLDWRSAGLEDFGRPGNYFERQIGRWTTQYRNSATDRVDAMERLIEYLPQHIPSDDSSAIAHGDYRIQNVMYHPTEPRIIAVLDWELSTIGHPLADLAFNCLAYHIDFAGYDPLTPERIAGSGIPSESAYVEAYCRRTGRSSIGNWPFYLAFSLFRLASIAQTVHRRRLDGNSSAPATGAPNRCPSLAAKGVELLFAR